MMEGTENNLLVALHNYAHRQSENFTTAAFAHLLRYLIDNEPTAAAIVIKNLTDTWLNLTDSDCAQLQVISQKRGEKGQPDIELVVPTRGNKAIVEVKLEARPRVAQSGYAEGPNERLIFLTRYPLPPEFRVKESLEVRWFQLADWLKEIYRYLRHETGQYLTTQFLDFLGDRGVTMERVDGAIIAGIRSVDSLMTMLREGIAGCEGSKLWEGIQKDYLGLDFQHQGKKYFVGVIYKHPDRLVFQIYGDTTKIDAASAENCGFRRHRNSPHWEADLNLAKEGGFLSLSKGDQIRAIEQFLKESLKASAQFTTPL